jgi:hypothetical protein
VRALVKSGCSGYIKHTFMYAHPRPYRRNKATFVVYIAAARFIWQMMVRGENYCLSVSLDGCLTACACGEDNKIELRSHTAVHAQAHASLSTISYIKRRDHKYGYLFRFASFFLQIILSTLRTSHVRSMRKEQLILRCCFYINDCIFVPLTSSLTLVDYLVALSQSLILDYLRRWDFKVIDIYFVCQFDILLFLC